MKVSYILTNNFFVKYFPHLKLIIVIRTSIKGEYEECLQIEQRTIISKSTMA